MGLNPMNLTPNLDRMAPRGVLFRYAFSNQPVCAPARASIFTGQYQPKHGVWRNSLGLRETPPRSPTEFEALATPPTTSASCTWRGPPPRAIARSGGPVPPRHRGGFNGLWEAANTLEFTSHAYEGDLYDSDGKPIHFESVYRAEFMTGRRALPSLPAARSPFLLALLPGGPPPERQRYLRPAQGYRALRESLYSPRPRGLPGTWPSQLADYYACVTAMDDCVGRIRQTLAETGLDRNTILIFTSDHACHFRTRNAEYKRSPHESSIDVPLIVEGPGFNRGMVIDEIVSQVDDAPSLLEACGLAAPSSMQGHNFLLAARSQNAKAGATRPISK